MPQTSRQFITRDHSLRNKNGQHVCVLHGAFWPNGYVLLMAVIISTDVFRGGLMTKWKHWCGGGAAAQLLRVGELCRGEPLVAPRLL